MITILFVLFFIFFILRGLKIEMYKTELKIKAFEISLSKKDAIQYVKEFMGRLDKIEYHKAVFKFWIPIRKIYNESELLDIW
jgi:hypothetical protein